MKEAPKVTTLLATCLRLESSEGELTGVVGGGGLGAGNGLCSCGAIGGGGLRCLVAGAFGLPKSIIAQARQA